MKNEHKRESKIIGWREWVALPLLGIPAIKGKIDTGAKTSSLHAYAISLETVGAETYINFKVHPIQDDESIEISCRALLIDRRIVTDSGGHREERYVIKTSLSMGGIRKKIELTLTNRETMKYRMLIGRSALKEFYVDPSQSFLTGKTSKQREFLKEVKIQREEHQSSRPK